MKAAVGKRGFECPRRPPEIDRRFRLLLSNKHAAMLRLIETVEQNEMAAAVGDGAEPAAGAGLRVPAGRGEVRDRRPAAARRGVLHAERAAGVARENGGRHAGSQRRPASPRGLIAGRLTVG